VVVWVVLLCCLVDEFDDFLAWFHVVEGFSGAVVEFFGGRVGIGFRVCG
jgi:hypothetical protein